MLVHLRCTARCCLPRAAGLEDLFLHVYHHLEHNTLWGQALQHGIAGEPGLMALNSTAFEGRRPGGMGVGGACGPWASQLLRGLALGMVRCQARKATHSGCLPPNVSASGWVGE